MKKENIPSGTFKTDRSIEIGPNLILEGAGKDKTVLVYKEEGLPVIPPLPEPPYQAPDGAVAICGQCGLRIMKVMGYSCSNSRCPVFTQATC